MTNADNKNIAANTASPIAGAHQEPTRRFSRSSTRIAATSQQTENGGPGRAGDLSSAGQQPDVVQHVRSQTDKGAEGTENGMPGSAQPARRRRNWRV